LLVVYSNQKHCWFIVLHQVKHNFKVSKDQFSNRYDAVYFFYSNLFYNNQMQFLKKKAISVYQYSKELIKKPIKTE